MPTKTIPGRRTATANRAAGRFGRTSGHSAQPRFSTMSRPSRPAMPALKYRPKSRKRTRGGMAELMSHAMRALPTGGRAKARRRSGTAKPAMALVAAGAGALFGRRRMKQRGGDTAPYAPTPGTGPTGMSSTPPATPS